MQNIYKERRHIMNKSESKYFNTAVRMDEALMSLLEKKDFEYITIKEICSAAGVNRSTFYLHYENTSELLDESISLIQEKFSSYFDVKAHSLIKKLEDCPKDDLIFITPDFLMPYLNFIKDHKRLYEASIKNPSNFKSTDTYNKMFRHIFSPILERFSVPEGEKNYIMAFYLNGIASIVSEWLKDDCKKPIDDISDMIIRCVLHKD